MRAHRRRQTRNTSERRRVVHRVTVIISKRKQSHRTSSEHVRYARERCAGNSLRLTDVQSGSSSSSTTEWSRSGETAMCVHRISKRVARLRARSRKCGKVHTRHMRAVFCVAFKVLFM